MRVGCAIIALAAISVSASANASPAQFDLICKSSYEDATFHYRVDLDANTFCFTWDKRADCATYALAAVNSDTIVFGGYAPIHLVNRVTGAWTYKDGGLLYRGTCSSAPFSGFPKLDTKF